MPTRRITLEHLLYILAFLLGSFFRLYHLGIEPLSDFEAGHALSALSQPSTGLSSTNVAPAYLILTRTTFGIFGSSHLLARFWPALFGSFIVFLPFFFRRELGQSAALVLAFGLACDPGLVAISRLASGTMMAIVFTLYALGWFWSRHTTLAGISAAFALLSGSTLFLGISILLLLWGISRLMRIPVPAVSRLADFKTSIRTFLSIAGVTVLAMVVLLIFRPSDLGSITGSLADYFSGWAVNTEISAMQLFLMLLVYAPLPSLLILTQIFYWLIRQSFSDVAINPPPTGTLIWLMVSIFVVLVYPGKQAADLGWVILPMWVLGAQILGQVLPKEKPSVISLVLAVTIFILLALFWNTIVSSRQVVSISAFNLPENTSRILIQLILFIGVIGLGGLSTLLVSLGWSWRIGREGLVFGITAGFTLYTISAMWGASHLRQNQPEELWFPAPAAGQAGLFKGTIEQVSEHNMGFEKVIDILSIVDTPSMRWTLRDFPKSKFAYGVPQGEMPSIVITKHEAENPSLQAAYRGQDFTWTKSPGWSGDLPGELMNWLIARQAPVIESQVILWVRNDMFPGEKIISGIE